MRGIERKNFCADVMLTGTHIFTLLLLRKFSRHDFSFLL